MNGQFTVIQNKVFDDIRLKSIDFTILAVLQSMMGVNGYCFPSYNYIADKAHCSRRTAISSMHRLVLLGYVIKERGTVGETSEQSSNRYYINNNPNAGKNDADGGANFAPRTEKRGVQNLHSGVVQKLHPEQYKFFEKNAGARACTRENENCTPNEQIEQKTESGNLPEQMPDDNHQINCPFSDDEIRRLREFDVFCKKTFKKDLDFLGTIFKRKSSYAICFRPNRKVNEDFDFENFKKMFLKEFGNGIFTDFYFNDEIRCNYDE